MNATGPRLVIFGAGRMGRLVHEAAAREGWPMHAVVAPHRPDDFAGADWFPDLASLPAGASLLIDFSRPEALAGIARWCAGHGVALVSGTTGIGDEQRRALDQAARQVPVLWAANFSPGLQLCLDLVARAAHRLPGGGDIHILDVHHAGKVDAPSGTALALGEATGSEVVQYQSLREGEVVGRHQVRFRLDGEALTIGHEALDRGVFAAGALRAGRWLAGREAGFYRFDEVLD